MLALLKTPSLRRFLVAHLQSELGTGAAYVVLLLVAYERLHSGWQSRSSCLLVSADLLRAGAFIALAVTPSFAATIGLALLAGIGTAIFRRR